MQNLCLNKTYRKSFSDLAGANVLQRFSVDIDKQLIYFSTSNTIYSFSLENDQIKSIHQSSTSSIEDLCYLSELNHLAFGLSNGDLLSLPFEDEFQGDVNVIGTLEENIHQLKLSPDQQILIAVTQNKVLLLMPSSDYEPIAETPLDTNEFGEQQFVNVGWGSKTTQFHGSAGKKAALESTTVLPIKTRSEHDDDRSRIVWRDDGDLFAVSFLSMSNQWRTIKIFNKQGQLQSTSESSLNGFIESAIGWKTSGELIGAAMRFNNGQKLTISFMEKNGLKHGEFILNSTGSVDHLSWNKDSTILAVVLREENDSFVQLWSTSNYHWYLKQSFPFPSEKIQSIQWDVDQTTKLHLITDRSQFYSMSWTWTSQVSYTNERSLVYLIDGCRMLITDFTHSSIPPPMSSYEIRCSKPIQGVCFDENRNEFLLILSDRSIGVCRPTSSSLSSSNSTDFSTIVHLPHLKTFHYVEKVFSADVSPIKSIQQARHFRFVRNRFYFIENEILSIFDLDQQATEKCPMDFQCLTTTTDGHEVFFQDENGKIFRFDENQKNFQSRMHFPRCCSTFSILPNGKFVGLTENFRLYLNSNELAHHCNSFFVHDRSILVYSTLQHQLVFRSLLNDEIVCETSSRRTERGSRIVCTAYADLKLVLQMPRGNLETIYPRPLLLTFICSELIDRPTKNYQRAFELMRKNRLNLNFLYDYKPEDFLENISQLIENARNDDDLCLFLSEIDNEKNIRDEYLKFVLTSNNSSTTIDSKRFYPKSNLICEKFRSKLRFPQHLNAILTSFVKQSPSNIEGALKFLVEHPTSFDSAIRYLTYFIDIDRLYDIALGTYSFDLVLMISEKTQKDPKEYLPELNQLKSIENRHWQKFQIDLKLKRFPKAIENGCEYFNSENSDENDEKFVEMISIVENQRLYKLALKNLNSKTAIRREILRRFGDYLTTKKYYVDAALVYERGDFNDEASRNFRQGKDVENALKFLPITPKTMTNFDAFRSLAEQFRNDGLHLDSARLYEYSIGDYEEALISYLNGHFWSHAVRLFHTVLRHRSDLYQHEFLETFSTFYDDLTRQIRNDAEKFDNFFQRLTKIRSELFRQIKEILDSGRDFDIDEQQSDFDDVGPTNNDERRTIADETGSIRTRLSKKSGSSKKSQRRQAQQQEKLVQLKEGSKHEDLALVRELSLIITKFDQLNGDVRHVAKICYQISSHQNSNVYEQKGEQLQNQYANVINQIDKRLTTIWLTQVEQDENVQRLVIAKKIREKFKKDLDLISNSYRVSPTLNAKSSQWKFVLFDSDQTV